MPLESHLAGLLHVLAGVLIREIEHETTDTMQENESDPGEDDQE